MTGGLVEAKLIQCTVDVVSSVHQKGVVVDAERVAGVERARGRSDAQQGLYRVPGVLGNGVAEEGVLHLLLVVHAAKVEDLVVHHHGRVAHHAAVGALQCHPLVGQKVVAPKLPHRRFGGERRRPSEEIHRVLVHHSSMQAHTRALIVHHRPFPWHRHAQDVGQDFMLMLSSWIRSIIHWKFEIL